MMKYRLKSKYKSVRSKTDGINFDSKLEAKYYQHLMLLKKAGDILFFLRQVPFDLPGNVKYRCDFVIFWKNGIIEFVDVKGYQTDTYKLKKKMVQDLYPVEIREVTKAEIR